MPSHWLTPRVFTIDGFLPAAECADLIQLAETQGFAAADVRTQHGPLAMPNVRNNQRVMVESRYWVDRLWQGLTAADLPDWDGQRPCGLPKDLRFYKYAVGQRFKMHKDGPWREDGRTSKLTLLVYLNDNFSGGATDFREFQVTPTTGTALLFIHDTWHEGMPVTAGVKYVLRSDVLYA